MRLGSYGGDRGRLQRQSEVVGGGGRRGVLPVRRRWALIQPVPTEVDGKKGDEGGQRPYDRDGYEGSTGRYPSFVV